MKLLIKALIFLCKEIINLLFPECCCICGKMNSNICCNECEKELEKNAIYKIENKENICYFEKHMYIFLYKNKIRNLIIDYKFNDKAYLYKIFLKFIIKNEKICRILKSYDIIIPVPIHTKRKKQRGYNQSELIAKELAKKIENLKYENKVLQKIKNTVPQSLLNKEERKRNAQNVYKLVNNEKIKNKKIILFDDVYTTGSTVNNCAKLLKEHNAKKIVVLTIAKD